MKPLAGTDYSAVPTTRIQQGTPAPPVRRVQPATAWKVEYERHYVGAVQRTTVHRSDCRSVQGRSEDITDEHEARAAMAKPSARGCIICGTDQSRADDVGGTRALGAGPRGPRRPGRGTGRDPAFRPAQLSGFCPEMRPGAALPLPWGGPGGAAGPALAARGRAQPVCGTGGAQHQRCTQSSHMDRGVTGICCTGQRAGRAVPRAWGQGARPGEGPRTRAQI
ncbi:DUF6233 domain-containing protein [Streptomyces cyaneofuscatus]|uniref:DUF6233 domain-containing protein n=1 Tax=Streptomyces cyaneofuscatus TaxID=66883 RepID=UPI0033A33501